MSSVESYGVPGVGLALAEGTGRSPLLGSSRQTVSLHLALNPPSRSHPSKSLLGGPVAEVLPEGTFLPPTDHGSGTHVLEQLRQGAVQAVSSPRPFVPATWKAGPKLGRVLPDEPLTP